MAAVKTYSCKPAAIRQRKFVERRNAFQERGKTALEAVERLHAVIQEASREGNSKAAKVAGSSAIETANLIAEHYLQELHDIRLKRFEKAANENAPPSRSRKPERGAK